MKRHQLLDGMRGIAAVIVAMMHFLWDVPGAWAPKHGYLAVDFFFILSGFVIARSYEKRVAEGGMGFGRFVEVRLIRLYPLYLVGMILGTAKQLGAVLLHHPKALAASELAVAIIFNGLMLPAPVSDHFFPLNGPSWSLFFELAVNILFVLVLIRLTTRSLVGVAVISALLMAWMMIDANSGNLGSLWSDIQGGVLRVLFGFTVGMIFSRIIIVGRKDGPAPRETMAALLPAAALVLYLCFVPSFISLGVSDAVGAVLVCPAILWVSARLEVPTPLVKPCQFLGDLSYPLYMVHAPFVFPMLRVAEKLHLPAVPAVILYLAVVTTVAMVVTRYFGEPVSRWLSRQAGQRRAAAA